MMNNTYKRGFTKPSLTAGFTLIELLVVIAIIGILASVVLASLNTARAKGNDAAIKSNLTGTRAAMEVFYDTGNTYAAGCADANVLAQINAAKAAAGISNATLVNSVGASLTATCNAGATGYLIEVPLKTITTSFFCVDGTGNAKINAASGSTAAGDYAC